MLDPVSTQLDRYLTLVSQRQKLVASNIANADTPGYKTQDFDFESQLHAALQSPDDAAPAPPTVSPVPGLRVKNDGNNVDLDREARSAFRKRHSLQHGDEFSAVSIERSTHSHSGRWSHESI